MRGKDQPASRQHDRKDTHSGEYENSSGVREESTDDNTKPREEDLQKNSSEEESDLHV